MNRIVKGLLVTVLAVSAAQVQAHTNKTFMQLRPTGVDLPMEYTTFNELINRKAEDKFGGNFQVTGFYKDSNSGDDLAEYFLVNNKHTIAVTESAAIATTISSMTDVTLEYLIHDLAATNVNKTASLSLDPQTQSYGVRIDYHQDLDKILKGLYLKANLPIVHVENNVKIKTSGTDLLAHAATGLTADTAASTVLLNYFNGSFSNTTIAANKQAALTHAKLTGHQDETGVADIDIALGYKFLNKHNYYASLAIAITIPTGNEADGVYAFEPIVGNGQHFGLGGDFNAQAKVWGDCNHNLKLNLMIKYRYLFESSEKRTLQMNNRPFSQYFLLVPAGAAAVIANLIPAANVLTKNCDVTPGSQFDGILGLAYNNGGFNLDLGYNMYFREGESVHLKDTITLGSYAIAARNFNVGTQAVPAIIVAADNITDGGAANGTASIVQVEHTNITAAETPSQFTNSIYAGFGYYFKEWETPLLLGLGGKYEWASKNSSPDQWDVYGKIGIGF